MVDFAGAWEALKRLRHARTSGRAEALFRVAFACVLLVQLLWLHDDVGFFYSTQSPSPPSPSLAPYYTPGLVVACYWVWLACAGMLLLGAFTRVAAVGCFLGCLYFLVVRQPGATHAADWLIPALAFHVALLPSNRFLALDRRFFARAGRADVAAWPLRLAQLSVAFFYFTAGSSKLADPVWRRGAGFYMTFANPVLSHLDLTWLAKLPVVSPALSYGVMAWECSMPLLLLWRRTRLAAVLSAVVFLTIIDVDLPVGWFSWFCVANLFAFADDLAWPARWVARFPWLLAPGAEVVRDDTPRSGWRARAVTVFLTFHLLSFAWLQAAYGYFAMGRYNDGLRMAAAPLLGSYGYLVANVRYYALWPSSVFYPLHLAYLELSPERGKVLTVPPLNDAGEAQIGWLESRDVRTGVMLAQGLTDEGWHRYVAHMAARYAAEAGGCVREIRAYATVVGPGNFHVDVRRNATLLRRASLTCPAH